MTSLNLFIGYAHDDTVAATAFREKIGPLLSTAKGMDIQLWQDVELLPGQKWQEEIEAALDRSDGGLLLISPSFFASEFIVGTELKALVETKKILLPVLLKPVDFARTDLKGLGEYQIFGGGQPRFHRAFTERGQNRDEFAFEAFRKIYDRLQKEKGDAAA